MDHFVATAAELCAPSVAICAHKHKRITKFYGCWFTVPPSLTIWSENFKENISTTDRIVYVYVIFDKS